MKPLATIHARSLSVIVECPTWATAPQVAPQAGLLPVLRHEPGRFFAERKTPALAEERGAR